MDVFEAEERPASDEVTVAFDAMRCQLALLTSAVEGFASRQEAIAARDYGPDLEKIAERMARVSHNINVFAERPAIALTPVETARQVEIAGKAVRQADHAALGEARQALAQAAQDLDGVVTRVRTHEKQVDALVWAALFGMVAAMLLILLGNAALERLGWLPSTEQRAVALLGGDRWKAGQALMAAENPARWREMLAATKLADANAETLALCAARARQHAKAARCTIDVPAQPVAPSVEHGRRTGRAS
jgi:hypothetical protein